MTKINNVEEACVVLNEKRWRERDNWITISHSGWIVSERQTTKDQKYSYDAIDAIAIAQGLLDADRVVELERKLEDLNRRGICEMVNENDQLQRERNDTLELLQDYSALRGRTTLYRVNDLIAELAELRKACELFVEVARQARNAVVTIPNHFQANEIVRGLILSTITETKLRALATAYEGGKESK